MGGHEFWFTLLDLVLLSENHKFQSNNQLRLKQYDLPKKEAPRDLLDAGGYSHELYRVGS